MDCRETRTRLTAFHDGELPAADRVRVEEHLRSCRECAARLADLARIDRAAGVPDPGPAYWERFNARVMDRVEREADGPKAAVLRPKHGWVRQQIRYLVPAAAAAALVVVVVRYGGMHPVAPTRTGPPAATEPAAPEPAGKRMAEAPPGSVEMKKAERPAVPRGAPPPGIAEERVAAEMREERERLADRSPPGGNVEASRDRAPPPAATGAPAPAPPMTFRGAPAGAPPVPAADGMTLGMRAERKKMEEAASLVTEEHVAGKAKSASGTRMAKEASPASPCELARTLADRERWRDAEAAQRDCLAQDRSAPSQEKGLVFLAELLDRQARFADADAVLADVDRQFPQSRPLDLYRQRRPMVQKRQE